MTIAGLLMLNLADLLKDHMGSVAAASGVLVGAASASVLVFGLDAMAFLRPQVKDRLMHIASGAALICVCGETSIAFESSDRRSVCRACGGEVRPVDSELLEKPMSREEIRRHVQDLRRAAMRAGLLELPPRVATLRDLDAFLAGEEPKLRRTAVSSAAHLETAQ